MQPLLILRAALTIFGVLVFVGVSTAIAVGLLLDGPDPSLPNETAEGLALFFAFIWPVALGVVWVCGTAVLLLDGRIRDVLSFLGVVIAAGVVVWMAVSITSLVGLMFNRRAPFPLRGVSAILNIIFFLALDAGAVVYAWQGILRGKL